MNESARTSRRKWTRPIVAAVVVIALAGALGWWFFNKRIWTDASGKPVGSPGTPVRTILWSEPSLLGELVNSADEDYEPALSPDGMELVFARGRPGDNAQLMLSRLRDGQWTKPVPLDAVNSPANDQGPAFTPDGRFLLFYSDRKGGLGGYDLYASERSAEGWSAPVNLGAQANSAFDDYGPAMSPDGKTLYFSSNRKAAAAQGASWRATLRQGEVGDFDLYSAAVAKRDPPASAPAGAPPFALELARELPSVNTPAHDGSPAVSPSGAFLYFSSNRPGGMGGFDLYRAALVNGAPARVENVGPPVNSAFNENDPFLALGGFRILFAADRPGGKGGYDLYTSESQEVFAGRTVRPLPHLSLNAILLVGAILLLAPLAMIARNAERRDLLQRCLLFSVLMHVVLLLGFSAVNVSRDIIRYVKQETGMELPVNLEASRVAEIQLQLRRQLTAAPSPQPPPSMSDRPIEPAMEVPLDLVPPSGVQVAQPGAAPGAMTIRVEPPQRIDAPQLPDAPLPRPPEIVIPIPQVILPPPTPLVEPPQALAQPPRPRPAEPASPAVAMTPPPPAGAAPIPVRPDESMLSLAEPFPAQPLESPEPIAFEPAIVPPIAEPPLPRLPTAHLSESPAVVALTAPSIGFERQPTAHIERPVATTARVPTTLPASTLAQAARPSERIPDLPPPPPLLGGATTIDIDIPLVKLPVDRVEPGEPPAPMPDLPRPAELARADIEIPRPTDSFAPRPIDLPVQGVRDRSGSLLSADASSRGLPEGARASFSTSALLSPVDASLGPRDLPTFDKLSHRDPEKRQPLVQILGGTPQTEQAVARALAYLAANQQQDGRWIRYSEDTTPRPRRDREHDVALTGLGALVFLAADHVPGRDGPYRGNIERAMAYLLDEQDADGNTRGAEGTMYDQAIATIALSEAAIMTGNAQYRQAAHLAAQYIVRSRDRDGGGWRYLPFEAGDMSVTGWQLMALHSARKAGYPLDERVVADALRWIDRASAAPQLIAAYRPGQEAGVAMTAQAVFSRVIFNQSLPGERVREVGQFVARQLPPECPHDYYRYYCVSLLLMQIQGEAWERWNPAVREHLLRLQRQGGPADGSWDPDDPWSDRGGRIYSTAIAALTLQVYYRYLPMYAPRP